MTRLISQHSRVGLTNTYYGTPVPLVNSAGAGLEAQSYLQQTVAKPTLFLITFWTARGDVGCLCIRALSPHDKLKMHRMFFYGCQRFSFLLLESHHCFMCVGFLLIKIALFFIGACTLLGCVGMRRFVLCRLICTSTMAKQSTLHNAREESKKNVLMANGLQWGLKFIFFYNYINWFFTI